MSQKKMPRDERTPWDLPFGFLLFAIGLVGLSAAFSAYSASGSLGLFEYCLLFLMIASVLSGLFSSFKTISVIFALGAPAIVWCYAGSRNAHWDLIAILFAGTASLTYFKFASKSWNAKSDTPESREGNENRANRGYVYTSLIFLLTTWVVASIGDFISESRPLTSARTPLETATIKPRPRIALALSGGGYRAALYHAGVLAAFEEQEIAVSAISSVSGGSIFGAFYTQGGKPLEFVDAVASGRFNLVRELLRTDKVVRLVGAIRIPGTDLRLFGWAPDYTVTQAQADLIDRLIALGKTHREGSVQGRPPLMICVTDIAQRKMIGILPTHSVARSIEPPSLRFGFVDRHQTTRDQVYQSGWPIDPQDLPGDARLADLVAASGAFPLAFPPLQLGPKAREENANSFHLLADGGIGDNLGVALIDTAARFAQYGIDSPWRVDLIVASDASAIDPPNFRLPNEPGALTAFNRTLNLIYDNSRLKEFISEGDDQLRLPATAISPALLLEHTVHQQLQDELDFPTSPNLAPPAIGLPPHSLETTDVQIIAKIVSRASDERSKQGQALINDLKKDGLWPESGTLTSNVADQRVLKLREIIYEELKERIIAFRNTSTLQSVFDRQTAHSLFLLGYYLALLDTRYIQCTITKAMKDRSQCEPAIIARPNQKVD